MGKRKSSDVSRRSSFKGNRKLGCLARGGWFLLAQLSVWPFTCALASFHRDLRDSTLTDLHSNSPSTPYAPRILTFRIS